MKRQLLYVLMWLPCYLFAQMPVDMTGEMPSFLGNVSFSKVNYYKVGKSYSNPTASNGTPLTQEQVARLQRIINTRDHYQEDAAKSCFSPEEQFVFFNDEQEIVGQLIISFQCNFLMGQPEVPMTVYVPQAGFTQKGVNALKQFIDEVNLGKKYVSTASPNESAATNIAATTKPEQGMTRGLAASGPVKAVVSATNTATYTVKKGDTMYAISRANGITVQQLQDANNMSNYNLKVGQALVIPSK